MGMRLKKLIFSVCVCVLVSGCGADDSRPSLFLPYVKSPEGADLEALRAKYCSGGNVFLDDRFLTVENFYAIFNCANYDGSLEELRPLLTHKEFPSFLENVNSLMKGSGELKDSVRDWLQEGPSGTSRIDDLLESVGKIIRNESFQKFLPLVSSILEAGQSIWDQLLPGLAPVIYQPRFPDNLDDISLLFENAADPEANNLERAKTIKKWARFASKNVDGKTVSLRLLELLDGIKHVQISTSLYEFFDHANEKGSFSSLYLDSGKVRGEVINPKLNADPDEEELSRGISFSPKERQEKAYRKLFKRVSRTEDAPIVQLAAVVEEFQKPHKDFLPAISRWFSANGDRVISNVSQYVLRAQILTGLPGFSLEEYLLERANIEGLNLRKQVTQEEFVAFLDRCFQSPTLENWVRAGTRKINEEELGKKNAVLFELSSDLNVDLFRLYQSRELVDFGKEIVADGKKLALNSAIKRYSNLHRTDKLEVKFQNEKTSVEEHILNLWWTAAQKALGESVVINFAVELVQTLFTEMAGDFDEKGITLSEWYFSSPYGDPGSTESIAAYAFKELGMMEKYHKHKAYLLGEFAEEVFPIESDREAFRALVKQVPNLWMYIKSGMYRSGADLTRALALKDRGYLIRSYVAMIATATQSGLVSEGARLIDSYFVEMNPPVEEDKEVSDAVEDRRKISQGADALKRVVRSLVMPEVPGRYENTTASNFILAVKDLVSEEKRMETEDFLLTASDQISKTSDKKIADFLDDFGSKDHSDESVMQKRNNRKALADLLREKKFPTVMIQLNKFFQDKAVKPALDYIQRKIDDGTLPDLLLFIRRVLGFSRI
ncbi:MAG: hypothetical protein M9962_01290 [Oligoflexia bacterium]|nr:hypothetical protein [Oligoflexia bacterium]